MKRMILAGVIVVAMLFGVVAYANAATSGNVDVDATALSGLELTVGGPVSFGNLNPGTASGIVGVAVDVNSNSATGFTVTKDLTDGGIATMGLTTSLGAGWSEDIAGPFSYTDDYQATVPWTTAPGPLTATVGYSVVAK